jgi:hypothetical protein
VSLDAVIEFKRRVYEQALNELARFLNADHRDAGSDRRRQTHHHAMVQRIRRCRVAARHNAQRSGSQRTAFRADWRSHGRSSED